MLAKPLTKERYLWESTQPPRPEITDQGLITSMIAGKYGIAKLRLAIISGQRPMVSGEISEVWMIGHLMVSTAGKKRCTLLIRSKSNPSFKDALHTYVLSSKRSDLKLSHCFDCWG